MKSGLIVAAALCTATFSAAADRDLKFVITSQRADDSVEISSNDYKTIIRIRSPSGISHASINRTEGNWPRQVLLRLHLKGLEFFQISTGDQTISASVSSHGENPQVRVWKDKQEDEPLDSKSPFWMPIQIASNDGKPAGKIPLKEGYFEITIPVVFFEDNPKSISIRWIDFYR